MLGEKLRWAPHSLSCALPASFSSETSPRDIASTSLGKKEVTCVRGKGDDSLDHVLRTGLLYPDRQRWWLRPPATPTPADLPHLLTYFGSEAGSAFPVHTLHQSIHFPLQYQPKNAAPGAKTTSGKLIPDAPFLCSSLCASLASLGIQKLPFAMILSSFSGWGPAITALCMLCNYCNSSLRAQVIIAVIWLGFCHGSFKEWLCPSHITYVNLFPQTYKCLSSAWQWLDQILCFFCTYYSLLTADQMEDTIPCLIVFLFII